MAAPLKKLAACWTFLPTLRRAVTATGFKKSNPNWKEPSMKEMNENQLLSWQPRRPSKGLKRRLLPLSGEDDFLSARWLWSCVAPAMACTLLAFMALNHDDGALNFKTPMALILRNQNTAAFASGGEQ